MLLSLKVKNYALIESLHAEFHSGLNIITGETGAGKSILLGALGLILGKRADTSVLSSTNEKCVVEAEFDIGDYKLVEFFKTNDLDYDNHTVLRREILPSGKSRAFVNDTPVVLSVIQELALKLVDIHSQHQTLQLNQQDFLLNIVDSYGKGTDLKVDYLNWYGKYLDAKRSFDEAKQEFQTISSEMDFINFQVDELTKARIQDGELAALEKDVVKLENTGEIKTALHNAIQLLSADQVNILDGLQQAGTGLSKILNVYPEAQGLFERLESTRIELKDLDGEIQNTFEDLDFDPAFYEKQKGRLDTIYNLLQKYKVASEEELIAIKEKLEKRQSLGVDGEFELERLQKELQQNHDETYKRAVLLSENRKKVLKEIASKVIATLADLGIPHGQLEIQHEAKGLSANGIDVLEFLFTANKNHPLQEISKIASGGELSRLMLAIKALVASAGHLPTIILDEIDSGVSGEIAGKVGNVIHTMSAGIQVVNITHLPQVASRGEAHFKVYKDHNHQTTKTLIKRLNEEERLEEIAKMLSGEALSEAALANAKELLNQ